MTLNEYKKKNNLTHEDMAKKLNISLSYYYKILNGERKPGRDLISFIRKNIPEINIDIFLN